ncbi:putative uncharacterized protein DDB_G0277255 [Cydia fagiglandana]|uniref:putative uncharacterized protein DDB_G0277255 n=1 Tax=Cydia fagiglandana TaxID=1458189 RepID=UPI002FEE383C
MIQKIMQAPLSIETYKQIFNERKDTTQTNVTTAAHNMNAISLIQDSSNAEGQSKPMTMNVNNNGTPTHLIEASTQQDTSSNDDNDVNQSQINTEQPWIDIKSNGAPIPLIMDQQDESMENNVETTIQPSVIQTTTKTVTKNLQSETFLQQPSDNIDIETAMALLHADTDEAPTNSTQNSKSLAKSTNDYELVSTTSVTMETTSHNIESNDIIMRTDTSNSEVHTNREVNINQIIENTVTVSIVKKIITNPNISLPKTETLLDILNKVHCAKEASIEENMVQTRTEDENKIKTKAVDDGFTKGIDEDDDQTKDVPDSKDDDRLIMARQNLARWSAYVKRETSGANLNISSKQIAENTDINDQKPDIKTDLINKRQTHSKPELIDDESDSTNKKQKDCNVKEQGVVIIADAPTSSKHVEINDQKKHNNINTPVNQNQTSLVVKLPRHMLKESTVEALIQCKKSKSNDNKSDTGKNLNMVLHDNYGKGNNNSSDPRVKPTKETVTTTAPVHGNKNIRTSLANDNNKEDHYSKRKTINTNKQKNTNTKNFSTNIQDNNNQERCANKRKSSSAENASSSNLDPQNINSNPPSNNNDANLESHSKKNKSISDETNPELQKIIPAVVDDSDTNHKRQFKKRKSTEIAPSTIPGTNNTSDDIDDQNKNQDQHSKRKKSICTKTATITSRSAQHSKTTSDNNDDNDRNHERSSKKRKSTSGGVAPTKNRNRNTNVSENNDKNHEAHSKRRKSISAESEIRANQNDCHNNCKNKEKDREARKNICGQLSTPEDKENYDKDTATKNNEEHATRQPNAVKNNSDETATSKNEESQKRKSITASNNDSNNSKEPCNPAIKYAANNKKDNNEVRKSTDSENTTIKDTGRLKNQTTTGSNVTSTETTTNNHTENQQSIILKIFRDHVESITRKNNNEKGNNSVTDDEKASDKSAEKLNTKKKDDLPRVVIPGKKENKAKDERKVKKCQCGEDRLSGKTVYKLFCLF